MTVIDLSACRCFLTDWDEVRRLIVTGSATGATVCLTGADGSPIVLLCGAHKTDPEAALDAAMQMSIELSRASDLSPLAEDDEATIPPSRRKRF